MTPQSFARKERRIDDQCWPRVHAELAAGGTLWTPTDVSRYYVYDAPSICSLSRRRVRRLEREGILSRLDGGCYALAEGR